MSRPLETLEAKVDSILASIGIKSIQGGYSDATLFSGTGEDAKYTNVTITAVDTAKSMVIWQPTALTSGSVLSTARLTSSTNLCLASRDPSTTSVPGRWQVIEFK